MSASQPSSPLSVAAAAHGVALRGGPERPVATGAARLIDTRRALVLAGLCSIVMLAATGEIVVDGSVGRSPLIPAQPDIAGWLAGIGRPLGYRVFLIAVIAFVLAYGGIVTVWRRVSSRWAITLVALLQLLVFVGPVLISNDVFSYIAYARMGLEHAIDPYLHGPVAIAGDPVFAYVGARWILTPTAYGPLYTLISYPLAPLGVVGALWGMKLEALLASAGTLALTWRCAVRRGLDQRRALLLVGANPLYIVYGLGGAHNDLIMIVFMMGAVALTLSEREASGAACAVAGAFTKATVAVLLPFMILSRRRIRPVLGAIVAIVVVGLIGYAVFGVHGIDLVAALNRDAAMVSGASFPNEVSDLLAKFGLAPIDHDLLKGALAVALVYLLWRTWRGYDWVAASGWALLAISVTSTWLEAWYILWPLPLAAIGRDRRLLWATLTIQLLYVIHQTPPLLAPVS